MFFPDLHLSPSGFYLGKENLFATAAAAREVEVWSWQTLPAVHSSSTVSAVPNSEMERLSCVLTPWL